MSIRSWKFRNEISKFSALLLRLSALVTFLMGGCGTETGNPIINRPKTPRLLAQDTTEAELQELAESALDSGPIPPTPTAGSYLNFSLNGLAISQPSLELGSAGAPVDSTKVPLSLNSFTCSGDKNRVTGRVVRKIEQTKQARKASAAVTKVIEREQNFVIESPLGALVCTQENGVRLRQRLLEGTTETREGTSKRTVTRTGEIKAKHYRSAEFFSSGKRTKKHDRVVIDATSIRVERTVEWNLEKKNRISTAEGDSSDESQSITAPGKPIKILVEYSDDEGAVSRSKTIQSGTTVTTRADGSKIEVSFENVIFVKQECYPTSGLLRGRITPASNSSSQPEEFSIDFSGKTDDNPELVFADGEKVSLSGTCLD